MRGDFPDLDIPLEVLESFPPDPSTLLELLCDRITPDMLEDLATREQNGTLVDFEKHLAGLEKIVHYKCVYQPLSWHPREVLELQRWGYAGGDWQPVQTAFACACLIQAMTVNDDGGLSNTGSLVNLTRRVMHFFPDLTEPTLRVLTHAATVIDPGYDEFSVCAFTLVAMLVLTGRMPDTPGMQDNLTRWLLAVDRDVLIEREGMGDDPNPASFAQALRLTQGENLKLLAKELMPHVTALPELANLAERVAGYAPPLRRD